MKKFNVAVKKGGKLMEPLLQGPWICWADNKAAWWMIEFTEDGCIGTSSLYRRGRGAGSCYCSSDGRKVNFLFDKQPETYAYKLSGDKLEMETPFKAKAVYRRATEEEYEKLHVPVAAIMMQSYMMQS